MNNTEEMKPVVVDGATVAQLKPKDDGFVVFGLKDQFFTSEGDVTREIAERRKRTLDLVEQQKTQKRNVRITIGNTLYDAILQADLWIGLPVEQSKTQTVVEVEDTDMLRASLQGLIANLESAAKANTRTERSSMRSRALIGAARQQLSKIV